MPFARGVFLQRLVGKQEAPKIAKFSHMENARVNASDQHQRWLKTRLSLKDVLFGDVNDIPLNFGSHTPKLTFCVHE